MGRIKCYLDTVIISAIIRRDISDIWEMQAILRIYSFWQQGLIECYTSEAVKAELEKIPRTHKEELDRIADIWMLLDKATMFSEESFMVSMFGGAYLGAVPSGGSIKITDKLFLRLKEIFPEEQDARHIYLSIKNGVPYFITYDKKTILNKAKPFKKELSELGISILSPKQFEDNLG